MNSRLDKLKRKKIPYIVICASVLVSLSLLIPFFRAPLLYTLRNPLIILTFIRREIGAIIFYRRNFTRTDTLRKELDRLKAQVSSLHDLNLENERLRGLLSFKNNSPYKIIGAEVIGRSADNWSSSIIIDKGRHHGIRQGQAAADYLGLIGRVSEAGLYTSKILLINDTNLSASCIVQRSRQEGLVSGTLGTYLIMKYLPQDADVEVGDVVITSGLNELYPKGLVVGSVIEIGTEFSGLSRYALVKPAVNLSNIEEVLVIMQ